MVITYEMRKRLRTNDAQSQVQAIEQRIKDLKTEEEAITKVCTQLAQVLCANAISPVNDDILEYIQQCIRVEEYRSTHNGPVIHVKWIFFGKEWKLFK
jgi:hypothetical protein